jgi:hypothetical protein
MIYKEGKYHAAVRPEPGALWAKGRRELLLRTFYTVCTGEEYSGLLVFVLVPIGRITDRANMFVPLMR